MMGEGAARLAVSDHATRGGTTYVDANGATHPPGWMWIIGGINGDWVSALAGDSFCGGGTFGVTVLPLNQNPVLQTVAVKASSILTPPLGTPTACNGSVNTTSPGVHKISGFRSAHTSGANFLMADGKRLLRQYLDRFPKPDDHRHKPQLQPGRAERPLPVALSTRAGGEPVSAP